jgi:hypothetical protein
LIYIKLNRKWLGMPQPEQVTAALVSGSRLDDRREIANRLHPSNF